MAHNIAFTSDMHGNERQHEKLVEFLGQNEVNSLILGGDIVRKNFSQLGGLVLIEEYLNAQRENIRTVFRPFIETLRKTQPDTEIFVIMGNDDCAGNVDLLEEMDGDLIELIHSTRKALCDGFSVVGYPFVPITPHYLKDWEKFDILPYPPEFADAQRVKENEWFLHGQTTRENIMRYIDFNLETSDSIERDLVSPDFTDNPEHTVYVMHAPPYDTHLDVGRSKGERCHLGSVALRLFTEKYQPHVTLHGHIHGTVRRSGHFMDRIGQTTCLASGNTNKTDELAVVTFDVNEPSEARRVVL